MILECNSSSTPAEVFFHSRDASFILESSNNFQSRRESYALPGDCTFSTNRTLKEGLTETSELAKFNTPSQSDSQVPLELDRFLSGK